MPTLDAQLEQSPVIYFGTSAAPSLTARPETRTIARSFQMVFNQFTHGKTGPHINSIALSELIGWAYSQKKDLLSTTAPGQRVRAFVRSFDPLLNDIADSMSMKETEIIRSELSVFSQRLAQDIYVVGRDPVGSPRRGAVALFDAVTHSLAEQGSKFGQEAHTLLVGARSQAAVMNAFKQYKFEVLVPDPAKEKEVATWDTVGGVDFVAIPEDRSKLFFINAKGIRNVQFRGGSYLQTAVVREYTLPLSPEEERAHKAIRADTLAFMANQGVSIDSAVPYKNIQITIPTSIQHLGPVGTILDPAIPGDIIAKVNRI